jgi:hypothetical protein
VTVFAVIDERSHVWHDDYIVIFYVATYVAADVLLTFLRVIANRLY